MTLQMVNSTQRGTAGTRGTPFRITSSIGPLVVLLLTVGCGQVAPDVRDDAPAGLPSPTSWFSHQEGSATLGPPVRVEGPTPIETVAWPAMTPSPSREQPPALPLPPVGSGVQGTVHGNPACRSWCGEPSLALIATDEFRNMETGARNMRSYLGWFGWTIAILLLAYAVYSLIRGFAAVARPYAPRRRVGV